MKKTILSKSIRVPVIVAAVAALFTPAVQSADLYWDQNGGAANTGGTGSWDLSSALWRDGSATGSLGNWSTGNNAIFGGTAGTVTLNTTGISATGLSFQTTGYTVAGNATNILTLGGTTPTIDVSVTTATFSSGVIAGTAGFAKTGTGSLVVQSASTVSGAVNVNAGTLSLGTSTGALASATSVTVAQGATLQLNNTASNNNNNRLGNIDITLNGGTLNFVGLQAASGTSESINRVVLNSGASTLSLASSTGSGAQLGRLTLSNATSGISRSTGATLNFVDDANGDIVSTNLATSNNIIGGWAVYTGTTATWLKSVSGSLQAYISTDTGYVNATDSTTWATTANVDATGVRTTAGRTINSLNITGSGTARVFTISSGTLVLSSGGLMATGVTGHSLTGGTVTAGTAAGAELFVYNNLGFTIDSVIGNNAGGAVNFVKSGAGTLTLSGTAANTFTGTSYINEGTVTMSKSASVNALGGDVVINGGTLGYGSNDSQISDSATVTLNTGTYSLGARAETIGALAMTGGTLSRGGATLTLSNASSITGGTLNFTSSGSSRISTSSTLALGGATFSYDSASNAGTGTVTLGGDVSYAASNTGTATFSNSLAGIGRLDLGTGTRIFNIADSTTLAAATAEVSIDWTITGSAGLTKSGTGAIAVTKSNTYTGTTTVSNGTLLLGIANALKTGATDPTRTAVALTGGNLSTGGFSQGTTGGSTLGALTLSGNSTITLGSSAGNEFLAFSDLTTVLSGYTGVLTIKNWEGTIGSETGGDNITFGLITGADTSSTFSNIQFDIGGTLYAGQFTSVSGGFELYAGLTVVPEPSTWIGGGLILGLAGWSQRKRFAKRAGDTLAA